MMFTGGRVAALSTAARRAALLALLVVLSGCSAAPSGPPRPDPTSNAAPAPAGRSALDIVGLWAVSAAEGAAPQTWLAMDNGWLTIWTPCSSVSGNWVSDGTRLRALVSSSFGPCVDASWSAVPWIEGIRGFEIDGGGSARFLGEDGATVAALTAVAAPPPFDFGDNGAQQVTAPVVTDQMRADDEEPAALSADLLPVEEELLAGDWSLAGYEGVGHPEATFADGGYLATDGCNGVSGPLLVSADGRFRAGQSGVMTLMGCDNVDLPQWIVEATRAGLDPQSGELVLVDRGGAELARLERTTSG